MACCWKLLLLVSLCCQCDYWCAEAAAASTARFPRRLHQTNEYLPPFAAADYGERMHEAVPSTTACNTHPNAHSPDILQPTSQINSRKSSSRTVYQKPYNSYAPPASGAAPFQYSAPQASNLVPLPALLPTSLVEQLSKSATAPLQQQRQPEIAIDNEPVLMIEQPAVTVLTPNQNRTLQAARILASTLLESNGEPPLEAQSMAGTARSAAAGLRQSQQLNTTDFLIVKSQKNAYIIPAPLAKDARNPHAARALYQMRDTFERAYTINQFIFVIKPERINFLNKLV